MTAMRRKLSGRDGAYSSYDCMKLRCLNPRAVGYKNYGGRGITICGRWRSSFHNFYADMGDRPPGMTLDRIDRDGNYEPSNCRWASYTTQRVNSSQFKIRDEQINRIKWLSQTGIAAAEIASCYGVSKGHINKIIVGTTRDRPVEGRE